MTRSRIAAVGLWFGLGVAAAAQMPMPKYAVKVEAEKNVDFSKFTTYTWTPGQPSPNKDIDARIVAAVDRELAGVGMTKAASGTGDVLVTYYSVSRTDVNLKAKANEQGLRPQYWVGTLVVGLLDPKNRQRLLRMRIDQPMEIETAKLNATIDQAVTDLFAKYPTRKK